MVREIAKKSVIVSTILAGTQWCEVSRLPCLEAVCSLSWSWSWDTVSWS